MKKNYFDEDLRVETFYYNNTYNNYFKAYKDQFFFMIII